MASCSKASDPALAPFRTAPLKVLAGDARARAGSLFGTNPGSVRMSEGLDPTQPILEGEFDAETGREIDR